MTKEEAIKILEEGEVSKESGFFEAYQMAIEALKQPEVIRCHQCGYWDRDTLRHQGNDFRDWNEAECMVLAERDGYNEINRYVEADDYCSYAERREK